MLLLLLPQPLPQLQDVVVEGLEGPAQGHHVCPGHVEHGGELEGQAAHVQHVGVGPGDLGERTGLQQWRLEDTGQLLQTGRPEQAGRWLQSIGLGKEVVKVWLQLVTSV